MEIYKVIRKDTRTSSFMIHPYALHYPVGVKVHAPHGLIFAYDNRESAEDLVQACSYNMHVLTIIRCTTRCKAYPVVWCDFFYNDFWDEKRFWYRYSRFGSPRANCIGVRNLIPLE